MAWKTGRASHDGQPRRLSLRESVAAGVVLRGDQHQAWASRSRFGVRRMAERAQDSEHCNVSGEDAEADGSDYGEAEDNGHQEGNHGVKSLWFCLLKLATSYW